MSLAQDDCGLCVYEAQDRFGTLVWVLSADQCDPGCGCDAEYETIDGASPAFAGQTTTIGCDPNKITPPILF